MANSTEADVTYEKLLTANLQRAIDFVKFAEAKNAALLALSSGWVVATLNLGTNGRQIPANLNASIILTLLFALVAALLAMWSFLPKLHLPWFLGGKRSGPHPANLLFFGDISKLPLKSLEAELHARYFSKGKAPKEEYIHDLVVQIGVNSQIAVSKMRFFRWGMCFIMAGGLVLLVPVISMVFQSIRSIWQT